VSRPLYLIDASVYVFRAWFSIPDTVTDAEGNGANALFGFGSFLCDVLERERPEHVLCAFDESLTSSFRNDMYPAYKANRPLPPPDLERQFRLCRAFAEAVGVKTLASDRYEADDLIGSAAARFRDEGFRMVYVTADKDYAQLIEDRDQWWDAARGRRLDAGGVASALGVEPRQVADLLGLAGDAVDNIPGVPGIGRKTAVGLLTALDTLEAIYGDLDRVSQLPLRGAARVRRLLGEHREQAFLSRDLTRICCDAPLECEAADLAWRSGDATGDLESLALPVQLRSRARRLAEA
jgi:5'-3' exonuclease